MSEHRDLGSGQYLEHPMGASVGASVAHVDTATADRMKAAFQRAPLTDGLARLSSEERRKLGESS